MGGTGGGGTWVGGGAARAGEGGAWVGEGGTGGGGTWAGGGAARAGGRARVEHGRRAVRAARGRPRGQAAALPQSAGGVSYLYRAPLLPTRLCRCCCCSCDSRCRCCCPIAAQPLLLLSPESVANPGRLHSPISADFTDRLLLSPLLLNSHMWRRGTARLFPLGGKMTLLS